MPVTTMMMSSLMGSGSGGKGQGMANIAGGLISGITGWSQKRQAKKMLKSIGEQPIYNIPQEILRNQKQAELNAQEGMPSQQYNNAMKNIQRTQSGILAGATDRRSALMALPRIQQQSNDALGNLDARDASMRQQNQQTLYGIGNTTAQYRDKAWNTNQMQPWQRKYNYANQLLAAGNQNFTAGLDKLVGGTGMMLASPSSGSNTGGKSKANYITSGQRYVPDGIYMDGDPGYSSNV
jgi:hypothetical protein